MPTIKMNCEIPPLRKGEVRIMFDDGHGPIVMDFEPGETNDELRSLVIDYLKRGKIK